MLAEPNGVIRKTDNGYEIVFVRRLAKPIEKVWAALTVPERIADWFTDMRFIRSCGWVRGSSCGFLTTTRPTR
jgi:hypothetical protein